MAFKLFVLALFGHPESVFDFITGALPLMIGALVLVALAWVNMAFDLATSFEIGFLIFGGGFGAEGSILSGTFCEGLEGGSTSLGFDSFDESNSFSSNLRSIAASFTDCFNRSDCGLAAAQDIRLGIALLEGAFCSSLEF